MDGIVLCLCALVLGFCYYLMERASKPRKRYFVRVMLTQDVQGKLSMQPVDWEIKTQVLATRID